MSDLDRLIACVRSWRGEKMALATVAATWGSAPRPVGSHMLVRHDGAFEGSVSGGCVEGDVIAHARTVAEQGGFQRLRYGVAPDHAWQVGLPCGGDIEILVQPVAEEGFSLRLFDLIDGARSDGVAVTLSTHNETGRTTATRLEGHLQVTYRPRRRMLVVGAVQIAQSLCRIAKELDFEVTLIDPRSQFLTTERFPGVRLDDRWPDEAIARARPDISSAVITLSHDSKIDDPALAEALATNAGYIAALGSKRSHAARLERLAMRGLSPAALARIEGPAGLPLGGTGPAEIALSIAAGAVKRLSR